MVLCPTVSSVMLLVRLFVRYSTWPNGLVSHTHDTFALTLSPQIFLIAPPFVMCLRLWILMALGTLAAHWKPVSALRHVSPLPPRFWSAAVRCGLCAAIKLLLELLLAFSSVCSVVLFVRCPVVLTCSAESSISARYGTATDRSVSAMRRS